MSPAADARSRGLARRRAERLSGRHDPWYYASDDDDYDGLSDLGEYERYKEEEPDSELVQSAAVGNMANVRLLVEKTSGNVIERALLVNAAGHWTEVEEKWGYDKTFEWYNDTALIVAARHGRAEVVRYLLAEGLADPTLETSVNCNGDDYEMHSAQKACEWGKVRHSSRSALTQYDEISKLLAAASPFWDRNPRARASYDYTSASVRDRCIGNRPTDVARLRAALAAVPCRPVTPAAGRASSSDEPELMGSATASEAVFARIRHAEASGRVIDLAADDDAAPAPKRVKTEPAPAPASLKAYVKTIRRLLPNLPASLKDYAERAFAQCSGDGERDQMQAKLQGIIVSAGINGTLNAIDWATQPLPPLERGADASSTTSNACAASSTGKCRTCARNNANRACPRAMCGSCCSCSKHKSSKRKR